MRRSFDNLARCYERLERLAFGSRLMDARRFCLPHARACESALLVGDGDGRFAAALLAVNPVARVESVDRSARMLEAARGRVGPRGAERLRTIHADATEHAYPENRYDFIALHFVLDCLEERAAEKLLRKLERSARPGAALAYSDFQTESRRLRHRAAVWMLYRAFRAVTDIQARALPRVRFANTFELLDRREWLGGLVFSEVWRKRGGE